MTTPVKNEIYVDVEVQTLPPTYRFDDEEWSTAKLKEYFQKCVQQIHVLMFWLTREEKRNVMKWLGKLINNTDTVNVEVAKLRNDYAWFLLVQISNGYLEKPFDLDPPFQLQPLVNSLSKKTYEKILMTAHKKAWKRQQEEKYRQANEAAKDIPQAVKPESFIERQPIPKSGIYVYGCVWSQDQEQ